LVLGVFCGTDFGTQVFAFAKQALYHLSHISSSLLLWLYWRWGLKNYLPRLALTEILLISASQVGRITGVSHQCWLKFSYVYYFQAPDCRDSKFSILAEFKILCFKKHPR
jgi:hypothetical protein